MQLSWNEVRVRAATFANKWKDAAYEKGETQSFYNDFFRIFGVERRSAKGNKDKPGKNVKAKAGLNRAILDQGWGEFRRQLGYKLLWNGGVLVAVPPAGTSRTCPNCGHISARNRPAQARFHCTACGFETHADQVGAINIIRAGHARLACEVNGDLIPSAAGTHRSDSGRHHNHAWTP